MCCIIYTNTMDAKSKLKKILKKDYSRLVTLPLFWLTIAGLEAGDYVEMTMGKENELVIKPYKKEEEEEQ